MKSRYPCPVCKNYTFITAEEVGDICPVCFWELEGDEGERKDITEPAFGPNGDLSIAQARKNYEKFGAVEKRFIDQVRKPRSSEIVE